MSFKQKLSRLVDVPSASTLREREKGFKYWPPALNSPGMTTITVNGERIETHAGTLAALIEELGHGNSRIATALNGAFVPASARAATRVKSGDAIEIVSARQGG